MFEVLKGGLYPNHSVYSSLVLTGAVLLIIFENVLFIYIFECRALVEVIYFKLFYYFKYKEKEITDVYR